MGVEINGVGVRDIVADVGNDGLGGSTRLLLLCEGGRKFEAPVTNATGSGSLRVDGT